MTKSRHFVNVQALRALAATLVVVFHISLVEGRYFGSHLIPEFGGTVGQGGVDLFFVISGFVMTTVSRGSFHSLRSAVHFIARRVMRIYPLYWFYSLIVFGVLLVMPQWVNSSTGHQADLAASFLLLPSDTLPLVMQGWTLTYEMYFYLVFTGLMMCLPERLLGKALFFWSMATGALAYFVVSSGHSGPALRVLGSPLVLEFVAGCVCALVWRRIRLSGWLVLLVGALGIAVPYSLGLRYSPQVVSQWRVLLFGVPATMVVLGAVLLEKNSRFVAPRWAQVLGDASYSLYLSHVLAISAFGRVYNRFALGALGSVAGVILCLPVVIAVGYVGFRLIERPIMRTLMRTSPRPMVTAS